MAKEMKYRRIGRSGLKVSALSFGSWVTFGHPAGRRPGVQTAWPQLVKQG